MIGFLFSAVLVTQLLLVWISALHAEGSGGLSSTVVVRDTLHSESLGKEMRLNIYLPLSYTTSIRYPVMYVVHGYTGHENSWPEVLSVDEKVQEFIAQGRIRPLIMVTLQLDNSFGVNTSKETKMMGDDPMYSPFHGMYEDYVVDDIIPYVDAHYMCGPIHRRGFNGGVRRIAHFLPQYGVVQPCRRLPTRPLAG